MSNQPLEFEDSAEATGHVYSTMIKLKDPRLMDWAKATDENFTLSDEAQKKLKEAIKAYDEFVAILENAE